MAITEIKNKSFSARNVVNMDSKRFFGCKFSNCILRYTGGQCEWDKNTSFDRCTWEFLDSALRTKQILNFIQMLNLNAPGSFSLVGKDFFTH